MKKIKLGKRKLGTFAAPKLKPRYIPSITRPPIPKLSVSRPSIPKFSIPKAPPIIPSGLYESPYANIYTIDIRVRCGPFDTEVQRIIKSGLNIEEFMVELKNILELPRFKKELKEYKE